MALRFVFREALQGAIVRRAVEYEMFDGAAFEKPLGVNRSARAKDGPSRVAASGQKSEGEGHFKCAKTDMLKVGNGGFRSLETHYSIYPVVGFDGADGASPSIAFTASRAVALPWFTIAGPLSRLGTANLRH